MIFPKVLQSLQNVHGIMQRWIEQILPNPGKRRPREILRLIRHKYHEEETGTEAGTTASKKSLPGKSKRFLNILWDEWKGRRWLSVICHPAFLQRQYSPEILAGLCSFLQKESRVRPEGIGQDLYFANRRESPPNLLCKRVLHPFETRNLKYIMHPNGCVIYLILGFIRD